MRAGSSVGEGPLDHGAGGVPAPVPLGLDLGLAAGRPGRARRGLPGAGPAAPFLGDAEAAGQPGHHRAEQPVLDRLVAVVEVVDPLIELVLERGGGAAGILDLLPG